MAGMAVADATDARLGATRACSTSPAELRDAECAATSSRQGPPASGCACVARGSGRIAHLAWAI
eukprot:1642466-Heterocapsa_arctica.AAC.1